MVDEKTYCPLIFKGLYIRRHTGDKKQVAPCCLADKSENFTRMENVLSHSYLEEIRLHAKNNKKHDACRACWDLESAGGESNRMLLIDQYKVNLKELNFEVKLKHLDYNTLPICNAKCIICSADYSSLWAAEKGIKIINGSKFQERHLDDLDLDSIETIYFNGGEPLLTNEHLYILKSIKNPSNVDLSYNTNGSCFPNVETFNLWKKFKSVNLFFSIDGIGERFEYTRAPLKWNQVSENIIKINDLCNIKICCSYTIGRHNVFDLEDTIKWFNNLNSFDVTNQFHVHYVSPPHPLSFTNIPSHEAKLFVTELEKFKDYYWYNEIKNTIQNEKT